MKLSYKSLFQVRMRHTFYQEGISLSDFRVRPTADTQALLDERGLVFRHEPDHFAVYAEVMPDTDPAVLKRTIGDENLCWRFLLEPLHPYLFNISQLDHYHMGRELFCFDNLRDDQADSRLYLSDGIAGARLGDPVALQGSGILQYRFQSAVSSAQLSLFDRFDNLLDSRQLQVPAGQGTTSEYRYDLSVVAGMRAGRYRLQDDQGGELAFYYAPALFGGNVFAVIELFNHTDDLTPDDTDRVPPAYRFLDGDVLNGPEAYTLQLEHRSTRWRYIVSKKYDNNAITLAHLDVTGPVVFDRADEVKRVVFTAHDPLPLAQTQQKITLAHNGTEIRSLPNPSLSSPVDGTVAEGIKYSDIYVYV